MSLFEAVFDDVLEILARLSFLIVVTHNLCKLTSNVSVKIEYRQQANISLAGATFKINYLCILGSLNWHYMNQDINTTSAEHGPVCIRITLVDLKLKYGL